MKSNGTKINLLFSIAGLHHGGAERVIESLCDQLDPDRFEITVCWRLAPGAIGEELRSRGIRLVGLPEVDNSVSPYLRFRVLKKILRQYDIDVIHTHDAGGLVDAAQCRLFGASAKLVHTFHFGNYPNLSKRQLMMEAVSSRLANRLVAVGYEQAKAISRTLRLPEKKLSVLYNGVVDIAPDPHGRTSPAEDRDDQPVVIGSVSTLTPQKGLPVLLEAAAILRDKGASFELRIAGDGPLREALEEQTRNLGLDERVHFIGWIGNASQEMMPSIDIFCQSSLWEANSIVLLEAMANGLPIVTTNVGESEHVIEDDECGLIAQSGDPNSLADALQSMIQNENRRDEMGRRAKARFQELYTVDRMTTNYAALYEQLVTGS